MGKFDGIMILTDLDGTLLDSKTEVSQDNIDAISYFKKEGGLFSISTGRMLKGMLPIAEMVKPNCPGVIFNGSATYDFETGVMHEIVNLDKSAYDVVEMILEKVNDVGVVVANSDSQFETVGGTFLKTYYDVTKYETFEKVTPSQISGQWKKILLIASEDKIKEIAKIISESKYKDDFNFVKSLRFLYEILPKGINKGKTARKLFESIDSAKILIGIGDGENDIELLKVSDIGIAVGNANDKVKAAADYVTVTNDESPIKKVIEDLENGKIKIGEI